ncbi:MAG TPA: hypothetical protein PKW07_04220 [Syntrophorhabdaceae bacterium]|nr:hypothetical protein [Syntrophorhabdaceae bacterium]
MKRAISLILFFCLILVLLSQPLYSQSIQGTEPIGSSKNNPSGTMIMFDLIIMRPLGIVACTIGTAGFIVSLPFVAFSGGFNTVVKELLGKPGQFTFERPLGDFSFSD